MNAEVRPHPHETTDAGSRLVDPDRFRAFYVGALPRVYGYLLPRCGGDVAAAEDLTQETFLAAVAEIRRGATIAAPVPWVLGIARHKLVDWYRRRGRETTVSEPWETNDAAASELEHLDVAPSQLAANDEERALTLAVLSALPTDQRAALVLRHMDGFAVPEVAAALGRSVHAAESLLARGRANFKRRYRELLQEANRG